jgi:glycosyltransferase involved in cell wall biosynthesis
MRGLSVIICTHNPRRGYLSRALNALRVQTLPTEEWELLLIDNVSNPPLNQLVSLAWHPNARHIREEMLGLTSARLRGIREAQGELLVFVDDDNLLDSDYLTNALELYVDYPFLGAFGGSIEGEFEVDPPSSIRPYLEGLAVRRIAADHWSNARKWSDATPFGAGLCVRREVADLYLHRVRNDGVRLALDRRGTHLGAGGDVDLAWTSFLLKKGTGCFARLRATHLIPKQRLTKQYVERINAGFAYAEEILARDDHSHNSEDYQKSVRDSLRYWCKYLLASPFNRRIMKARRSGQKSARETISKLRAANSVKALPAFIS